MPAVIATSRSRTRAALACLLLAFALGAAAPASSIAASVEGGNAFSELSQKAQEEETSSTASTATSTTGTEKEPTNSGKTIIIASAVAVVLLLGIAFVIVRDARRVAPAGPDEFEDIGAVRRDRAVKQQNRRAKAKAAKAQRRKNR